MRKIIIITSSLLLSTTVHAFRLAPMSVQFAPSGGKATQVLVLENNETEKVPVQIEVTTREIDTAGNEKRTKTDDFVVYPEQVVLLPNEKRNLRVTWNGGADFKSEKAFRIIATQLPLQFQEQNSKNKKTEASLNFLVQYVASAYVTPPGSFSKVRVAGIKLIDAKNLEIELHNEGSAHQLLKTKKFQLLSGDKTVLEMDSVKELESENILAGGQRKVTVKLPKEVTAKNLQLKLSFEDIPN